MAKAAMLAWSNPSGEGDDAYNEWYDSVHATQVAEAIPGVTEVRRYRLVDDSAAGEGELPHRYLAIYVLESDDVAGAAAALGAAGGAGKLDMSTAIDLERVPPITWWYVEGGGPAPA